MDSHYEQVYETQLQLDSQSRFDKDLKKQVYNIMSQFDGWCSEEKAGILIDVIRCLSPEVVVEVGVGGGKSLIPISFALKQNCSGKVYGLQPWKNHEYILRKIAEFNLKDSVSLTHTSAFDFKQIKSIDLLHINGNQYDQKYYFNVEKFIPLVRKGGFIILNDLTFGYKKDGPSDMDLAIEFLNNHGKKIAEYHDEHVWGIWVKE